MRHLTGNVAYGDRIVDCARLVQTVFHDTHLQLLPRGLEGLHPPRNAIRLRRQQASKEGGSHR
jgi:hypothetical protein